MESVAHRHAQSAPLQLTRCHRLGIHHEIIQAPRSREPRLVGRFEYGALLAE